jgi:hypothetical protein
MSKEQTTMELFAGGYKIKSGRKKEKAVKAKTVPREELSMRPKAECPVGGCEDIKTNHSLPLL